MCFDWTILLLVDIKFVCFYSFLCEFERSHQYFVARFICHVDSVCSDYMYACVDEQSSEEQRQLTLQKSIQNAFRVSHFTCITHSSLHDGR